MLTLSLPTRREVTITVLAVVLFFVYFNLGATDDRTRSNTGRSKAPGSLQSLRDKALGFVLGPSGPDYSREFGAQFAKSMESQLAHWKAHDQVKLRNVGTARDSREDWGDKIPQTRIITSLPGWHVLDNVIVFKGSIYIITDDREAFPPMSAISNWWQIHFKNTTEFADEFGSFAGRVTGVSWMCTDEAKEVNKFTLMGMQRLHSTISDEPPARLVFPRILGPRPPPNLSSSFLNLAFPALSVWLMPEWNDFGDIIKPWLYERVVLVSMGAASQTWGDAVGWAPPFFLPSPDSWWTELRDRVHQDLVHDDHVGIPVVTYFTAGRNGLRLGGAAREQLIVGLERLRKDTGVEVNILDPSDLAKMTGTERMRLIARTTILLGSPSFALDDAIFLRPGATLMEFFPPGILLHDHSLPLRQMGIQYIAWWDNKSFDGEELPPATETMPYTLNATLGENAPLSVESVLASISARVIGDL